MPYSATGHGNATKRSESWKGENMVESAVKIVSEQQQGISSVLGSIIDILVKDYQPECIILFGSHARGAAHADSDVDLLIIKDTDETPEERWLRVKKLLNQINRQIAISPLVYTPAELEERLKLNDFFLTEIIETGKWLYGRKI